MKSFDARKKELEMMLANELEMVMLNYGMQPNNVSMPVCINAILGYETVHGIIGLPTYAYPEPKRDVPKTDVPKTKLYERDFRQVLEREHYYALAERAKQSEAFRSRISGALTRGLLIEIIINDKIEKGEIVNNPKVETEESRRAYLAEHPEVVLNLCYTSVQRAILADKLSTIDKIDAIIRQEIKMGRVTKAATAPTEAPLPTKTLVDERHDAVMKAHDIERSILTKMTNVLEGFHLRLQMIERKLDLTVSKPHIVLPRSDAKPKKRKRS